MLKHKNSSLAFQKAKKVIAGGVNSPVRAFKAVGGKPIFFKSAKGSKLYDLDGNEFIDFVGSWGPAILGHAHPQIVKAVQKRIKNGFSFGAPTEIETKLAELITSVFPSIEKIRFVNSGTEATMSAIRLARAYSQKDIILKFDGCYHGHADSFLFEAGSGLATFGRAFSTGVPQRLSKNTISLPFNNLSIFQKVIKKYKNKIAAVILEPFPANMGLVLPQDNFLENLRKITQEEKIVLIFDEVITGFRVEFGGVQTWLGIKPDLTCLGKIIGGGLPVGAFGGRKDVMSLLAPEGLVYQAGTLSGNPIAMAAGYQTLKILSPKNVYKNFENKLKPFYQEFQKIMKKTDSDWQLNHFFSMFTLFFTTKKVFDYKSAKSSDTKKFAKYFHLMLKEGIYLPPSQFETVFISMLHTEQDLEQLFKAAEKSLKNLQK